MSECILWDYEEVDYETVELFVAKTDKGKMYKMSRICRLNRVLFWLKFCERLDVDSFKKEAQLSETCEV